MARSCNEQYPNVTSKMYSYRVCSFPQRATFCCSLQQRANIGNLIFHEVGGDRIVSADAAREPICAFSVPHEETSVSYFFMNGDTRDRHSRLVESRDPTIITAWSISMRWPSAVKHGRRRPRAQYRFSTCVKHSSAFRMIRSIQERTPVVCQYVVTIFK